MSKPLLAAFALVPALTTPVSAAAPADDPPPYIVTVGSRYLPSDIVLVRGSTLSLLTLEVPGHDITAAEPGPNGQPAFKSDPVSGVGDSAVVRGVEFLEPGTHQFLCAFHEEMRGSIIVVP